MFSATGTFVCFVNLRMAPVRGIHLTEVAVGVMHTLVGRIGKPWLALFFQFFSRLLHDAIAYPVLLVHVSSSLCFRIFIGHPHSNIHVLSVRSYIGARSSLLRGHRRGRQGFGLGLEQGAVKYLDKVSAWTRLRSVDRGCCGAATMMTQSFCGWVSTSQDDDCVAIGSTCIRFWFSVLVCMSTLPCHTIDLKDLCVFSSGARHFLCVHSPCSGHINCRCHVCVKLC